MTGKWNGLWIFLIVAVLAFGAQALSASAADCPKNYDNFGKAFIDKYCISCHTKAKTGFARKGTPKDANFDDAEMIKKEKGEIFEMVLEKGKMPPKESLTDEEKADLKAWLDCEYK